ncbi:tRNA(m5U54)methyltransferase [Vanrija albida]|uniref:tRNA(M5U54)methyltransferase n=1 Tax=Vanrija albida TaxID=181172 RepID=A0ABR3PX12_9TREE
MSVTASPTATPPPKRVRNDALIAPTDEEAALNAASAPSSSNPAPRQQQQRKNNAPQGKGKRKRNRRILPDPYSPGDILYHDVVDFLGKEYTDAVLAKGDDSEWDAPEGLERFAEIELTVGAMTVSGESLSLYEKDGKKWAIVVPFAHPKDKIRAKLIQNQRFHTTADLVEIVEYCDDLRGGEGDRRKNPEAGCKYFGECGGCQLQPVPYAIQLKHKQRTVDLAYKRYANLDASKVPEILPTIASPKQWAYRTKITPHFDAVPKWVKAQEAAQQAGADAEAESTNTEQRTWTCKIGFDRKGMPGVLDIEECPIATDVLNAKMGPERQRIKETISTFKRGATLLLRDSLPAPDPVPSKEQPFDVKTFDASTPHIAVTNHKEAVYEKVGDYLFSFSAGSFFQNNNSILIPLTDYVKEAIFPPGSTAKRPTHLVDTYCGSGLFGITLSSEFERIAGVDVSPEGIAAAGKNAGMNGLLDKTTWLCGKAEDIFGGLAEKGFGGDHSCIVIDPPRKGCDTPFLEQFLNFKPLTAVYVSCNVHTQARDIGWLISESEVRGAGKWRYELESLRGFDLFPQTAHVESVGVLRLVGTN